MKDKKQLLIEIMDDINKNQLSREIELDLIINYRIPQALKIKDKEDRKVQVESLENAKKQLKEEMEMREYLIKTLNKKLNS